MPGGNVAYPRINPQTGYRSMAPGEVNLDLFGHPGTNTYGGLYADQNKNIISAGGRLGHYGGTVGIDNGHAFANMNHNGQPTDPLSALRALLGF
jgi:hypothetical protein